MSQMGKCITLSALPPTHSRTLIHLETIQKRNQPTAPPTAPKSAPFFLPTAAGVVREFISPEEAASNGPVTEGADAPPNGGEAGSKLPVAAEHEDEWGAAAKAAGYDGENGEMDEGGNVEGTDRPSKRSRRSHMLSSNVTRLSKLQQLLRAAGEAAAAAGWVKDDEEMASRTADDIDGQAHGDGDGTANGGASVSKASISSSAAVVTAAKPDSAADAAVALAYDGVTAYLLSLSPSALDLELRSLGSATPGEEEAAVAELRSALHFFAAQLSTCRAFELLQAALCVFFRVHQETVASIPALRGALLRLQASQEASWGTLRHELHNSLCMLSHICRTNA